MREWRRPDRGLRLLALMLGAGVLTPCNRVREVPDVRRSTVKPATASNATLELQVVYDPIVVSAGRSFVVPVRLRNVTGAPVTLMFLSSCSFRLAIATASGRVVAQPGSLCLSVIREPTLKPGDVLDDSVTYTIGEPGVVPLEPGTYRVIPVLLSVSAQPVAVREARLEVRATP
jgi:hypothetical protein